MNKHIPTSLLLLLAAVFALSPFAIDSYLPAIPTIAGDLGVKTSLVAVTVSIYVLGMAIGQLIGGPLSDRLGRKPTMVSGLLVFAVGSFMMASVDSLDMLWAWRIVQALGGGIAVVGVPATIRDNAVGKEAARLFSLIALIMMLAPSLAPTVGTLILRTQSWHWIFYLLCFLSTLIALNAMLVMPNAKPAKKAKGTGGYLSVIRERRALGFLLAQAFGYAVLMTFITNAPLAYIDHFGVSAELFSGLFIANVIGIVIINRTNTYLLRTFEPSTLLKLFLSLQLIGGAILITSQIVAPEALWFIVPGFVISIAANGGIMANSSACFMRYFDNNAGVASALLGAVQYGVGAGVSAFAAMLGGTSLWPMIIAMVGSTLIALAGAVIGARHETSDIDAGSRTLT